MLDTPSCQAYSREFANAFGYRPSLAAGIAFVILFFLSSSTHLYQAFRYKSWWLSLFVVGAGAECLGWIARLAAHKCAYSTDMFIMQIALLIFAPAWTTAGVYVILFRIIPIVGKHSSPFPPKLCLYICVGVDFISLLLQAIGGGLAGRSFHSTVSDLPGTYIMTAGILFQLTSTLTYSALMSIVFTRAFSQIRLNKPLRWLAGAMVVVIICMIARNVYRAIELLEGWRGTLNTTESYVIALDGTLMLLAVVLMNICNPGRLLRDAWIVKEEMQRYGLREEISEDKAMVVNSDSSVV